MNLVLFQIHGRRSQMLDDELIHVSLQTHSVCLVDGDTAKNKGVTPAMRP